jgi:hypothetical protein
MSKFFKAWFYRKGRFFPPYLIISLFLFCGIAMMIVKIILVIRRGQDLSDTLLISFLTSVMTFCGVWSWVVTKDKIKENKNVEITEERRGQ